MVPGRGVPVSNVAAVVFNLTAVSPTQGSYLTAFPAGPNQPVVSNLNVDAGVTRANQVTVPVGTGGAVSLYNAFGSLDLLADVLGYYDATNGTSGGLVPLLPGRIFDSRTPEDGPALFPNEVVSAGLTLDDPAMDPHITALSVNITAINADASGYLSTWDGAAIQPTTSTVNFGAHDNVPNAATIRGVVDTSRGRPQVHGRRLARRRRCSGWTGSSCSRCRSTNGELEQAVETTATEDFCRGCGVQARLHDRRPTWVRDLPVGRAAGDVGVGQAGLAVRRAGAARWRPGRRPRAAIRPRASLTERARAGGVPAGRCRTGTRWPRSRPRSGSPGPR